MSASAAYDEKLVYMANQIARNFSIHGEEKAVASTLDHIRMFWDPRMRARILDHLRAGGVGLEPTTRRALELLSLAATE